ncbi:2Fe-2S iron-sulfur cluster-binding protein [Streptomyces tsukubensis]|uniref:2Fe-2S iron-sulfur cluster-binding protein n=1 Tax=Streptomyces tsukubensis TaxID=83656 RepID=UPI0034510A91
MPQGAFDHEATAFVQLPPEDALHAAPLEAPGHGYVPPMILPLTPVADPQVPPEARLPEDHGHGHAPGQPHGGWPEPAAPYADAPHRPHDPHSTGQWVFPDVTDQQGAGPATDVTGQWTIPVARGDLPEETGEYTPAMLQGQQWHAPAPEAHAPHAPAPETHGAPSLRDTLPGTTEAPWASGAPATLPGGASAPWAPEPHPHPHPHPGTVTHPEAPEIPEAPETVAHPEAPEAVEHSGAAGYAPPVEPADPAGQAAVPQAAAPAVERPAGHPSHPQTTEAPEPEPAPGPEAEAPAAEPAPVPEPEAEPEATADPRPEPEPEPGPESAAPEPDPEPETPLEPVADFEEHPPTSYVLRVNGTDRPVTDAWIGESLLYVLRERLGLAGAKDGCSQGECGACNVQVDGRLVASCLVPAATASGTEVRTVEGLAADGELSDVQRALAEQRAVQCGFCIPGMAMTVHDLLEGNHRPTDLETRQALCGNLCRCSGYRGVLDAVHQVVAEREASAAAAEEGAGSPAETPGPEARIPHQAPPGAGSVQPHPHDGGMA